MKHGVIIPYYEQATIEQLNALAKFSNKWNNVIICIVSDKRVSPLKETFSKFEKPIEDIHLIHVRKETRKEDSIKKAALFLLKKTDVDTIGLIDLENAKSFSDYHVLLEMEGKEEHRILTDLKKLNIFDKMFYSPS